MIKDKLKEIRENIGMNKKEFANCIGIKYTTYNGYETGAREPDSDFLILIAQKFDVRPQRRKRHNKFISAKKF